jgi:hypothetical protein
MDALTRELALYECIAASDAVSNALVMLEENTSADEEWQVAIRRHVFPLLEAEHARLDDEYHRLR